MSTAADRGWGPGWPHCQENALTRIRVADIDWTLHRDVAPIFAAFIAAFDSDVEILDPGECWSFACRAVRGTKTVPSNHSWGLAVDLNSVNHPWGRRNTFHPKRVAEIRALLARKEFRHIRWGGDYKSRPDEMHFEYIGTPADAKKDSALLKGTPTVALTKADIKAIGDELVKRLGDDLTHPYTGASIRAAVDRLHGNAGPVDVDTTGRRIAQLVIEQLGAGAAGADTLANAVVDQLVARLRS